MIKLKVNVCIKNVIAIQLVTTSILTLQSKIIFILLYSNCQYISLKYSKGRQ